MPRYAFKAVDKMGATKRGEGEAANENELFMQLSQSGLSLVTCTIKNATHITASSRIALPEQVLLCKHLVMMVEAGVPVHLALRDIIASHKKGALSVALQTIHDDLTRGSSLSQAFEAQGARFDVLFSILLRAGEKTGRLAQALSYLHETLQWKTEYKKKLRAALSYPLVQIVLAAFAVAVLMLVAVPQITELLGAIGQQLPWYSKALLFGMNGLGASLVVGATALILFFTLYPLCKIQNDMAVMVDGALLKLPLIGPLINKFAFSQITHLFGAMLASGIPAMEALALLPNLTANQALAAEFTAIRGRVGGGKPLSEAFGATNLIPPYVLRLLKMGEDGGRLADVLKHISSIYAQESQQALDNFLKIISLFITLAVGLVLAALVIAILYPLYQGLSLLVAT